MENEQLEQFVDAKNKAIIALYNQLPRERDRNKRREILKKIVKLKKEILRIRDAQRIQSDLRSEIMEMELAIREAYETIAENWNGSSEELKAHIATIHSDLLKKVKLFYLSVSLFFYCECNGN